MKADVRLIITDDGSHTAVDQRLGIPYHSVLGAVQESKRVYIELGLLAAFDKFPDDRLRIFEMGFGTGLNALLTAREADQRQQCVDYTAIDAFPLAPEAAARLNYDQQLTTTYLAAMHQSPWQQSVPITPYFCLTKWLSKVQEIDMAGPFHLIYFDAFAPASQPELWEPEIFRKMADLLLPGGILTTYCSKSYVQRNLRAAGFVVEKHPGPRRKREVLRAIK